MRSLEPLLQDRTVLLITHRPLDIGGFDQVLSLHRGRLA